jgi:hypothetical protein
MYGDDETILVQSYSKATKRCLETLSTTRIHGCPKADGAANYAPEPTWKILAMLTTLEPRRSVPD